METRYLIKAMVADGRRPGFALRHVWYGAAILAVLVAAAVFLATLGPRQDILQAVQTVRFPLKFVITLTLFFSAYGVLTGLSRPADAADARRQRLLAAPILLAIAIILELLSVPSSEWVARLIGSNSLLCFVFIPLIGLGPLAVFLTALRYGATTRPTLAGATAGLLAGSLAATFYAAHCPDDSPLFVATWYTVAIAAMALASALIAPRIVRW
jgi:hypothetical protein